jgi:hypothetical protein
VHGSLGQILEARNMELSNNFGTLLGVCTLHDTTIHGDTTRRVKGENYQSIANYTHRFFSCVANRSNK